MVQNPLQMLMQVMQLNNDPNSILQDMLSRNPNNQILLNQFHQSGMSPRQFAEQLLKQNNINVNDIINLFNQRGIKL